MIKLENTNVYGWEAAIRGMRNPLNSWDKSDSTFQYMIDDDRAEDFVGENDLKLMKSLSKAGSDHAKFLRMINVTVDITAPLYWWKEFDTYKVGTVWNSTSTMHRLTHKMFEYDDFSYDHLFGEAHSMLGDVIDTLNQFRRLYITAKEDLKKCTLGSDEYIRIKDLIKTYWWQMIQLLPSSYNQKRTVQLNYQVLKSMYFARRHHKLDEWREFCKWAETLPYFKEICINEQ